MGSDEHGLSLPGHQAYARGDKLESLHSKNQMLEKENIELKKQLDDISVIQNKCIRKVDYILFFIFSLQDKIQK